MAKLARALQKIFGSGAGANEIAKIGSLRGGAVSYSTDPVLLQSLTGYALGLVTGIVSSDKYIPPIEEINAIYYLFSRQLAYGFQEGIPEYDATTTYFTNGIVKDTASRNLYYSKADGNLGNALSDTSKWGLYIKADEITYSTGLVNVVNALTVGGAITGNLTGNISGNAATVTTNANLTGDVTSVGNATAIASGVIVNGDINASAGIVDTKLATIATAGKVSNSATTATSANTASAIVARDASGNFTAGTITAALSGNVTGNVTGNASTATNATTVTNGIYSVGNQTFSNSVIVTGVLSFGALTGTMKYSSTGVISDGDNANNKSLYYYSGGTNLTINTLTGGTVGQLVKFFNLAANDVTFTHLTGTGQQFKNNNLGSQSVGRYQGVDLYCDGTNWYIGGKS